MDLSSNIVAISGVVALIALVKLFKWAKYSRNKGKRVPEVAGALPFIGHMHLLRQKKSLGRIFGEFADKYGSIFSIRFDSTQAKVMGNNGAAIAFAPYGPYWRNMRKFITVKLLSGARIKMLNYIPESELNDLMRDLYNHCNEKIDMRKCFNHTFLNIAGRIVAGKRIFFGIDHVEDLKGRPLSQIVREFQHVSGQMVPGDYIPFIGWFDYKGVVKRMKNICAEVDTVLDGWIEEHKQNKNKAEDKKDFIDVMLSEITDDEDMGFDQAAIIRTMTVTMINGGSDTTTITLTWVLSNLLNNREALKRCHEELDLKVGRNRWVQVGDVEKLEYLSAVVKETFRLNPPGPIGTPKIVEEDFCISGYHIPKGSQLSVNVWKLHRDPNIWSNPDEFLPERFLTEKSHVEVGGNNFEFLPFGTGRRMCPATNFAMNVVHLTIARFLQGFNITTPNDEPVDMSEETQNLIMGKDSPLEVILTPRLAPQLYDQECNLS
ncbi:Cytochrome P450 82A3 [Euphorbia peplus]|nr:Cytochrome P450 82A3 [Euphorbia peplus]